MRPNQGPPASGNPETIPGEYPMVSRRIRHYQALRRAHLTPITPADARALVDLLAPDVQVAFRGYKGRARPRAKAISLPAAGWAGRAFSGPAIGRLRVGIVLHELAHITALTPGHGPRFIAALDRLLELTAGLW